MGDTSARLESVDKVFPARRCSRSVGQGADREPADEDPVTAKLQCQDTILDVTSQSVHPATPGRKHNGSLTCLVRQAFLKVAQRIKSLVFGIFPRCLLVSLP